MAVEIAYSEQTDIQRDITEMVRQLIGEGTSEIQRMVSGKKLLQRHKV